MIDSEKLTGAREFILQEHQGLYSLYQSTKEVGDNRLNFYVTFVAGSLTITATMYSFILPELRPWQLLPLWTGRAVNFVTSGSGWPFFHSPRGKSGMSHGLNR